MRGARKREEKPTTRGKTEERAIIEEWIERGSISKNNG